MVGGHERATVVPYAGPAGPRSEGGLGPAGPQCVEYAREASPPPPHLAKLPEHSYLTPTLGSDDGYPSPARPGPTRRDQHVLRRQGSPLRPGLLGLAALPHRPRQRDRLRLGTVRRRRRYLLPAGRRAARRALRDRARV